MVNRANQSGGVVRSVGRQYPISHENFGPWRNELVADAIGNRAKPYPFLGGVDQGMKAIEAVFETRLETTSHRLLYAAVGAQSCVQYMQDDRSAIPSGALHVRLAGEGAVQSVSGSTWQRLQPGWLHWSIWASSEEVLGKKRDEKGKMGLGGVSN